MHTILLVIAVLALFPAGWFGLMGVGTLADWVLDRL